MTEGRNILRDGPTELLFLIAENFMQKLPRFNTITYKEDIKTVCGDHETLKSMCLVSQRLGAVATVVLYHTIIIEDKKFEDYLSYAPMVIESISYQVREY